MGMIDQLAGDHDKSKSGENRFAMSVLDRSELELNDRGNAARLLAKFGSDLIFVTGRGWGVWDGTRYSFQSGPLRAAEIAAKLPDLIQEEIQAVRDRVFPEYQLQQRMEREAQKARGGKRYLNLDEVADDLRREAITRLAGHKIKCGNVDKQNKALKAMEWQVRAEIQNLDSDPWSFTVQNGTIDLRRAFDAPALTVEHGQAPLDLSEWRRTWLVPTDRSSYPTKCAGTVFVPGATCPEWDAFIELILPNKEVRYCLQRAFGAMLFGMNVGNAAILLRGGGGNGKSTLISMIGEVLGMVDGYAAPAKVEMFLQTQNESPGKATPEEVDLPGARAILASEPAVTDVFSAKKIKALTGGDPRPARALGMPQFIYRPSGIPVIQFNRTPKIKDEDPGTRRRLVFVPLEVNLHELPPEQRKSPLVVERALRAELPGILNWMLDGFRDFQARVDAGKGVPLGIDPPTEMLALKDRIMEAADPVGTFLKECCDLDEKNRCRTADFFKAFKAWARDSGARVFSDSALRDNLTEKGFPKVKSNGLMCFSGFALKDDPMVQKYLEAQPAPASDGYSESDFA